MALNINQFGISANKGCLDLHKNSNTIACVVDSSQSTALVPGQCVTIVDSAGGSPKVIAQAADTGITFGVVNFSVKDASFAAGSAVEISMDHNVIYMEASAAIARGAKVMPVITGSKVATATTGKPVMGIALDKAAADGDLIRVMIISHAFHAIP